MASDTNQVFVSGRLTRNPELASSASGLHFAKFTIASSELKKDQYQATYFDCVAFGDLGEKIYKKLIQGSDVFISGSLRQHRWNDNEGNQHSKYQVLVTHCTEKNGAMVEDLEMVGEVR